MILLVTGGREYACAATVENALAPFNHEGVILVQGGAAGADRLAKLWAERNGIPCAEIKAYWGLFGKSAGGVRNTAMLLLRPDLCVAFPGNRGTADMVAKCGAAGVPVLRVY